MKDVNLVLREKELDIMRLRREIKALHFAIPLLADERDRIEHGLASQPASSPSQRSGTTPR